MVNYGLQITGEEPKTREEFPSEYYEKRYPEHFPNHKLDSSKLEQALAIFEIEERGTGRRAKQELLRIMKDLKGIGISVPKKYREFSTGRLYVAYQGIKRRIRNEYEGLNS